MISMVVWQRLIVPMTGGGEGDLNIVLGAMPTVGRCPAEFARIKGGDRYLAGPEISLADLFLAPIFAYFVMTPDAKDALSPYPGLRGWWDQISARKSMEATAPKMG